MQEKGSSFPLFLNVILSLLLIGSIAFGYFFGNFGGISIQELKDSYILKDEVKFSDLPSVMQENYIKKDELALQPKRAKDLEKAFDEFGNPIDIIEGDVDDLQTLIKSLQDRVVYLEQENMILSNDKNELLKIVQSEKSSRALEESNLLSKNLEKINEAEQQHYKNISELTLKINDLQRENIALSDKLNRQKEAFNEELVKAEKKVNEEKKKAELTQSEALKVQLKKYELLERTNSANEEKLLEVSKLLQSQRENEIIQNAKKDKQIVGLQNKINELIIEKNTLLSQNSKNVLDLEKQSSAKLQKIEETIREYQKEKKDLQTNYEKLIKESREKFNRLIAGLKKENSELKEELSKVTQNSVLILENSEKSLTSKEEEYKKLFEKVKKDFDKSLSDANQKVTSLEKELEVRKQKIVSLQKEIDALTLKGEKTSDTILQLNDKINTMAIKDRSVDKEVEAQVSENEKKHNENYRYLNEKIASLQKSLRDFKVLQESKQASLKSQGDAKVKLLEDKYSLLNADFIKAQKSLEKAEEKEKKLLAQIGGLQKEKTSLEQSEHQKLIEIRDSFTELQTKFKQKESEYKTQIASLKAKSKELAEQQALHAQGKESEYKTQIAALETKSKELAELEELRSKDKEKLGKYLREITALKKTLKAFEGQIANSDTVPISDKKRKLALLGQVECDDMNSGNFKVSSECKAKVSKFLESYSESNYFEVIPIVGTGGFGSLNKIKKDKTAGIPDSEIERLTGLANLGLGKHRAKEGGWLIREKFGDFAKISYTVYNIEAEGKRGFVIRAYR